MKHLTKSLLTLGIACSAISAFAANGFSGEISFGQPNYKVHELVEMKLSGEGLCKSFDVSWGDGVKTSILAYYFNMDGPLKVYHKYKDAKTYFPTISANVGPTSAEQCGSRSGKIDILPTGVATSLTALPAKVQPGETITVTLNGSGQCKGITKMQYDTQPLNAKSFAADAPWPRVATFNSISAEGEHFFRVHNEDNSNTGDCAKLEGVWVTVKKNPLILTPVIANPLVAIKPVQPPVTATTPTKPTTPADKPCKKLGKEGVGKDCSTD